MNRVMLRFLIATLLLLTISAQLAWSRADPAAALALAKTTSERMLTALQANRSQLQREPERIYGLVEGILLPHFDFKTMARWVLGKYWRRASTKQRERFTEEFRALLVRTYAKALLEYSNEKVRFLPLSAESGSDDVVVRSEIKPNDGPVIPIHYGMHLRDDEWKVYDVVVDGISLVTNYRSSLGGQIKTEGLDAIIAKLNERNSAGR